MAERHRNEQQGGVDRRTYLKLAAAATTTAVTGLAGAAAGAPDGYDPDTVVDLGEEGLSEGDVIDPYLEEHFRNGVEVRIPEGEYGWRGGALRGPSRNAGLVGEGEVILQLVDNYFRDTIAASGGVITVQNITVRGTAADSRVRLEADSGGHVHVDNWNFPDGSETDDRSRAFYSPRDHAGVVEIRNCYIRDFSDNGIYASSPGYEDGGAGGQVIVEGCVTHNINISGIRVGSSNSVVRNCVVINDDRSPDTGFAHNQRGIWVRGPGDDIVIENCDVIHSWSGATAPVNFGREGDYSSGHIENVRIYNDGSADAIRNCPSAWSGNDIDVTGDGNLSVPDWFTDVCQGGNCTEPSEDVDDGSTEDGSSGDGSTEDGSTEDGSSEEDSSEGGSSDATELVLVTTDSGGIQYEFTTSGEITPLYDRDEYRANQGEPADYAEENDDGTWSASGATSGGSSQSGDSFSYEGDMLEFSASGDVDGLTVYADGEEVNPDDLIVESEEGEEDGSGQESDTEEGSDSDGSGDESGSDEPEEELSNRLIIDGTDTSTVASYEVSVTGDVEADESTSSTVDGGTRWDDLDDETDGGTATGVVGKGIDGYRYSGEITSLDIEGSVRITVESNDL